MAVKQTGPYEMIFIHDIIKDKQVVFSLFSNGNFRRVRRANVRYTEKGRPFFLSKNKRQYFDTFIPQ